MLAYNLSKIIHNIWLQQSRKRGAYLYVMTLNDDVQTFKQFAMFYVSCMVVTLGLTWTWMNYDYLR
jgi:hypothetical protein